MAMAMAAGAAIPVLSHVLTAYTSLRTSLESIWLHFYHNAQSQYLANPLVSCVKDERAELDGQTDGLDINCLLKQ